MRLRDWLSGWLRLSCNGDVRQAMQREQSRERLAAQSSERTRKTAQEAVAASRHLTTLLEQMVEELHHDGAPR